MVDPKHVTIRDIIAEGGVALRVRDQRLSRGNIISPAAYRRPTI